VRVRNTGAPSVDSLEKLTWLIILLCPGRACAWGWRYVRLAPRGSHSVHSESFLDFV